jgi:hypothetical protein
LFGAYAALLAVATFLLGPVWHDWDWTVFQYLSNLHAPAFSPSVAVVDLEDYDQRAPARDRQTIARFLDGLRTSNQRPAAVLLDLYFDSICATADPRSCGVDRDTAALTKSLDEAAKAKPPIRVYATENPIASQGAGQIDPAVLSTLDREHVYDHLAAGHTILSLAASDGIFYAQCYRIAQTDAAGATQSRELWALPYRVVQDAGDGLPACDAERAARTMEAVRLGPQRQFEQSVQCVSLARPFPPHSCKSLAPRSASSVDWNGKYVIVATLENDLGPLHKGTAPRSNPELLAWAVSDLLKPKSGGGAYFEPLPLNEMLAALVIGFGAVTLVAFIAAFQGLRRLRLKALRRQLPWIAAAAAVCFALALFGAVEALMFFAKQIPPQVSLVAMSVVLAGGLCGERGREILVDQARTVDAPPEESNEYDVFISYAHDEREWVRENVYLPLANARTADGRKLDIFFDTSSIRAGVEWEDKILLSLAGSRFVIAVYSETYFTRRYCLEEVKRARSKSIMQDADGSLSCLLPIMRGTPVIPLTLAHINAVKVDDNPDAVPELVAQIVASIDAAGPRTAAKVGST